MQFYRFVPALILVGCASPPSQPARESTPEPAADPSEFESVFEQDTLARQEQRAFFERRFAQAETYWRASELEQALEACEHALLLAPVDEAALRLRQQIRHDLGYRDGTVSLIANEAAGRYEVRIEEEKLTIRRLLHQAETAKASGDWKGARRSYERALFILKSSSFRANSEIAALRGGAEDAHRNLRLGRIAHADHRRFS